jgi:hypothetical protein
MKKKATNDFMGMVVIIIGMIIIAVALGDLLLRVIIGLLALSLINYGLRLRGLPPLQVLIPMMAHRNRFF